MGTATRNNKLLPFVLIEAATAGNVNAINAVLKHFERYIIALATRELYDENGNAHLCVDEELKRLLLHGILHLAGYDHSDNSPEQEMLKFQETVLSNLLTDADIIIEK